MAATALAQYSRNMTRAIAALLFTIAMAHSQTPHQHHPPRSADEYAKVLEDPARDAWQKPHEVITALKLKPSDTAADIGAGSGYFTRRLARHAAHVFAVDIDPALLALLAKDPAANVTPVLAAPDNPRLPAASCDLILIVDVLHHIDNRPAYYPHLAKALKPGGRLVIIDFHKKELPVGPPPSMKLTPEEVTAELKAAGLKPSASHGMLPYQYFLEFTR